MCLACHYRGDNRLVDAATLQQAHPDGDLRCIRTELHGGQGACIDCGETCTPRDDHMCWKILDKQVFGTRSTRYADELRAQRIP